MSTLSKRSQLFIVTLTGYLLYSLLFYNCASMTPGFSVSQYRFDLDNEIYRIRSIASDDQNLSSNELIASNFLAVDFDQDGIIDCITIGEGNLNKVQQIYEHGITILSKENRIQEGNPENHRYVHEIPDLRLEIKSFHPDDAVPFNEFKVTDIHAVINPIIGVSIDHNADGNLDEVIKGKETLEELQSRYTAAIEVGLRQNALQKVDSQILVIER